MKRICVFCGASSGKNEEYAAAARQLALLLVEQGVELVYGGGNLGVMGELSRAFMDAGGRVTGIIPRSLAHREVANRDITSLHIVSSMHERKKMMHDLSDAFIALPGGVGTLEEFAEMLTWSQLGIHQKPCGLLNVAQYYDHLIAFLDHAVSEDFIAREHRALIIIEKDPGRLLQLIREFRPPANKGLWVKEKVD
ncbi:MAG: LOG family protein [Endomicrobiales bacterium]